MFRKKCKTLLFSLCNTKSNRCFKSSEKETFEKNIYGILNYFVVALSTNYCVHV